MRLQQCQYVCIDIYSIERYTLIMKDSQLQIRVSRQQKLAIKRAAARSGQDISSWVLSRCLSEARRTFEQIIATFAATSEPTYLIAELNDFLSGLKPNDFADAVSTGLPGNFDTALANRIAAMVEYAAHKKNVAPPRWTTSIPPSPYPVFDTELQSLRMHLLLNTPAIFKRRNLFLDSSIGDRV